MVLHHLRDQNFYFFYIDFFQKLIIAIKYFILKNIILITSKLDNTMTLLLYLNIIIILKF